MKAVAIAVKDIKGLLKSPRFFFSLLLSSLAIIGLKILYSGRILVSPIYWTHLIFTFSLPCLGLAILASNSDILTKERSAGTLLIIFSQPISDMSIILGKFMAMFFSSFVFASLNALLIKIMHPYIWEITGFLSEGELLGSFFVVALLFQLPIIGLTLLFSSMLKRSATVTIMVILIYQLLAVIYSSQLLWTLPGPMGLAQLSIVIQMLFMLIGSILGYDLVMMVPFLNVKEPSVTKYIPVNVNAQRIFYFLVSPNPEIGVFEIVLSVSSLIAIFVASLFLSFLVIRRTRREYLE